jgi:Uncharacterized NAD(FAD)-dependent dehydrogenases
VSRERLVVVGADAGGMTAASQARRRRGAESLEIIAIDRGRHASYSACGIPYWIGGLVGSVDALLARTVAEFRKQDIEVRLRQEAVGLDLDAGVLTRARPRDRAGLAAAARPTGARHRRDPGAPGHRRHRRARRVRGADP